MKKLYFIAFLPFLISCEQLRSGDLLNTSREDVMEDKLEDRDINLPTGSTILEEDGGFKLQNLFSGSSGSSMDFNTNSLAFNVALDKLSFIPLISADINSGVIITDSVSYTHLTLPTIYSV